MIGYNKKIKVIEYEAKYLEDVKDLLVELEEYLVGIDKDNLEQIHEEYRDMMAVLDLDEVNNNCGKCYLALDYNNVIGLVMGCIFPYEKYDYLDYKCPKRGEVTELVIAKNARNKGVGKLLLQKIEKYFNSLECEYVIIDVFAYNEGAINFYNKNGYHTRMITNIKKL